MLGKKLSQNRISFKSQKSNAMKTAKSAIDPAVEPRVNRQRMKTNPLSLAAVLIALLFASSSIGFSKPDLSPSPEDSVQISNPRVVKAPGPGSYVTGIIERSFGYAAPMAAVNVHVAVYGANGKLLAEKVDIVNGDDLVGWRFNQNPTVPFTVFFPWEPSQIAKVTAWTQ
jgi:hypothetical protein